LIDLSCRACGPTNIEDFPHDIHGTGIRCGDCGRFIKWMGKGNRKNRLVGILKQHEVNYTIATG